MGFSRLTGRRALVAACLSCVSLAAEAAAGKAPNQQIVEIDWHEADAEKARKPPLVRVRADTPIAVRVTGFNFLHYGLSLDVTEKTIEAYALLEGLWSGVLRLRGILPALAQPTAPAAETFEAALREWLENVEACAGVAGDAASLHPQKVGLSAAETEQLVSLGVRTTEHLGALAKARGKAHGLLLAQMTLERWLSFRQADEAHQTVEKALSHIERAASLAKDGKLQALGARKAGTLISIVARAKAAANDNDAGHVGPFRIFVESRLPLHFHAGPTYTDRKQVDFEKVRDVAGADVFQEISGPDSETGLSAFLTYELKRWGEGAAGLSLGTDVDKPGDKIYVGGTLRFKRFALSAGRVSTLGKEGVDPIGASVAGRLGAGKLYGTFARTRSWATFAALSFSVFP